MIPILYPADESSFTTNGIGRLADASSCIVTEEKNGIYELEFEYPMTGVHYKDLANSMFVKAVPAKNVDPQYFRIYEISKEINGKVRVSCEHISYELLRIVAMPFQAVGASNALQALKDNAVGDCPFTFWTNITASDVYTLSYPNVIRGKLQGDQWSITQEYGGELEYDNYNVKLWENRGSDKGFTLRYGKNLKTMKQEESIQNTYTGIVPYWYGFVNDEQTLVTLPEKAVYSEYVDNFPTQRVIAVDMTSYWEEAPSESALRTHAAYYIRKHDVGIPKVSLSVSFVDLSQTEDYKSLESLQSVNLCDTVTVIFEELGVSTQAKVTRTVWDVLNERYKNIYIGGNYSSLASSIVYAQEETQEVVKTASVLAGSAAQQATQLITGNKGGYVVLYDSDGDGKPDELLIMDTQSVSTATKVWRWNSAGWGYSSTGYDGEYTLAATMNGAIVADFITAGTLNGENLTVTNLYATNSTVDRLKQVNEKANGLYDHLFSIGSTFSISSDTSSSVEHADTTNYRAQIYNSTADIGAARVMSGTIPVPDDKTTWGSDALRTQMNTYGLRVGENSDTGFTGYVDAGEYYMYDESGNRIGSWWKAGSAVGNYRSVINLSGGNVDSSETLLDSNARRTQLTPNLIYIGRDSNGLDHGTFSCEESHNRTLFMYDESGNRLGSWWKSGSAVGSYRSVINLNGGNVDSSETLLDSNARRTQLTPVAIYVGRDSSNLEHGTIYTAAANSRALYMRDESGNRIGSWWKSGSAVGSYKSVIDLCYGNVDASGNLLDSSARRTQITPTSIFLGGDNGSSYSGTLYCGSVRLGGHTFSTAIPVTYNGTTYYVPAATS